MCALCEKQTNKHKPNATRILDLGSGPGEPGCTLAARFGVPTVISDVAPPMTALAEKRVAAKGLQRNAETMTLDLADLSPLGDASFDLLTASHCFQFCPDKQAAVQESFRVLAPGGLLLAAVWEEVGLMAIGGEIMAHVTGGGAPPPPFNPNGPLGLRDAEAFDAMLVGAGFELDAEDNGFLWNWEKIELGPLEGA